MTLPEPFYELAGHIAIDLPGARAVFTTRRGGHSAGPYESLNLGLATDDEPELVRRNRATATAQIGSPPLRFTRQVHGADVRLVRARDPAPEPSDLPHADGQATADAGVAPAALVADCLPIAVAGGGAVAIVHGGWRGLAAGIVAAGVAAVRGLGDGGELWAAVGPGAGPCCYEVGPEVHEEFAGVGAGASRPQARPQGDRAARARARRGGHGRGRRDLHDLLGSGGAVLAPARARVDGTPGRDRMVDLIGGLRPEVVRANLERVRARVLAAGRDPADVEVLAAVKYLPASELEALALGGITVVGENRAQELIAKEAAAPGRFTWDFIGHLQSRKVKDLLPHVRYIHSVASDSALAALERHGKPDTEVLVEVNVAREAGKSGIGPDDLAAFLERCPVTVVGLMTMPPLALRAEENRPHFAALRALAQANQLRHLSMGTSQDYVVAIEEGATIVRLGSTLYAAAP